MMIFGILLIFIQFSLTYSSTTTVTLLKVDAGLGISFVDLWNLNGVSTGSDSDSVYRSGIIDNGFQDQCPSRIYIQLLSSGSTVYTIQYRGTYTDSSPNVWMTTEPYFIQHSVPTTDVSTVVAQGTGLSLQLASISQPGRFFLVFDHSSNSAPYTKYYHTNTAIPISGPIPGNEAAFASADTLKISARYDTGACDLVDHNSNTPIANVINQLQSGGVTTTVSTTQAETTTESTTRAETTTESTTRAETTTTEARTTPSETETTTEPVTTAPAAGTVTPSSEEMCPCECEFKKRLDTLTAVSDVPIEELKVQLAPEIKAIKENLTVDASTLSSTLRKLTSASDSRPSAGQIGVVGAVLLGFTFGLLILIDITSIPRHIMLAKKNWNCFGAQ